MTKKKEKFLNLEFELFLIKNAIELLCRPPTTKKKNTQWKEPASREYIYFYLLLNFNINLLKTLKSVFNTHTHTSHQESNPTLIPPSKVSKRN